MKKKTPVKRANGMVQTSIVLPAKLLKAVGEVAKHEHRSRNMQIQKYLEQGLEDLTDS